jgi:hypothetical protein
LFGCLRRAVSLIIVLALVVGIYLFRERIRDEWRALRGHGKAEAVASPELGDAASRKIEQLRDGKTERVALGAAELQSLVEYKYQGLLPSFAQDPHVELEADHVHLRVRIPVDKLPDVKGLGDAAAFLPDTTEIELSGTLIPFADGRTALGVDKVQAARIPLPSRLINDGLRRVGRRDEPGLPKDAIAVTLPPGVKAAYIRNDSLILLARSQN